MNTIVMQIPYNRDHAYDDLRPSNTDKTYYPLHWEDMRMIFHTLPFYVKVNTYERVESVVWAIDSLIDDFMMP
jgi:hypothetical protein